MLAKLLLYRQKKKKYTINFIVWDNFRNFAPFYANYAARGLNVTAYIKKKSIKKQ